jgi:hypothetical protein
MADKSARLAIFIARLRKAPLGRDAAEATSLIATTLNAVEDELSGIVFDPASLGNDGRLYPPRDDYAYPVDGRPDVTRFRNKAHNTFVATNGAFRIETIGKQMVFEKPGADGLHVFEDDKKP